MQTAVLILGVCFASFALFVTADDQDNYYLTGDNTIGTRREGEYYDAYPVPGYTSGVSTADEKQGIDEFTLMSALPGVFALMGVIAIAWAQANDHQNQQNTIDDQKTKQTSICTTLTTYTALANIAQPAAAVANDGGAALRPTIVALVNRINALGTPNCT